MSPAPDAQDKTSYNCCSCCRYGNNCPTSDELVIRITKPCTLVIEPGTTRHCCSRH
jgi:hypothetical protein